jgi:hypothetical protein
MEESAEKLTREQRLAKEAEEEEVMTWAKEAKEVSVPVEYLAQIMASSHKVSCKSKT